MISPDLRGFGFSLFGNNEDLDSNNFPDFIVGAALSSHVVGLRTLPIIRLIDKPYIIQDIYIYIQIYY